MVIVMVIGSLVSLITKNLRFTQHSTDQHNSSAVHHQKSLDDQVRCYKKSRYIMKNDLTSVMEIILIINYKYSYYFSLVINDTGYRFVRFILSLVYPRLQMRQCLTSCFS